MKSNPVALKDPKGLFIAGGSCSPEQRKQIDDAEEILKELNSSCGGCDGAKGCIPCEHWETIRRAVQTSTVNCSSDQSLDCGEAHTPGSNIKIFPLGFGAPKRCGALKATLLHEAMHNVGIGGSQQRFINDIELDCFGSDAVDRGYPK